MGSTPSHVADDRVEKSAGGSAGSPCDDVHAIVNQIWREVFGNRASAGRDLLRMGAGVQRVIRMLSLLERAIGVWVSPTTAFKLGTAKAIADAIVNDDFPSLSPLILLRPGKDIAPLFVISGGGGFVVEQVELVEAIDYPGPVYGLQLRGFEGIEPPLDRVEDIATYYLDYIYELMPHGPYHLLGYSFGGSIGAEMGQMIKSSGRQLGFVGVLDGYVHESCWPASVWCQLMLKRLSRKLGKSRILPARKGAVILVSGVKSFLRRMAARNRYHETFDPSRSPFYVGDLPPHVQKVRDAAILAYETYRPSKMSYQVTLLKSKKGDQHFSDPEKVWRRFVKDLKVIEVPGSHKTMVRPPHAAKLASVISQQLAAF